MIYSRAGAWKIQDESRAQHSAPKQESTKNITLKRERKKEVEEEKKKKNRDWNAQRTQDLNEKR